MITLMNSDETYSIILVGSRESPSTFAALISHTKSNKLFSGIEQSPSIPTEMKLWFVIERV
jgi:hypothetical protein